MMVNNIRYSISFQKEKRLIYFTVGDVDFSIPFPFSNIRIDDPESPPQSKTAKVNTESPEEKQSNVRNSRDPEHSQSRKTYDRKGATAFVADIRIDATDLLKEKRTIEGSSTDKKQIATTHIQLSPHNC